MKSFLFAAALTALSFSALASDTSRLLQGIGDVYVKVDGPCADFIDVAPAADFATSGLVALAHTNSPGQRPLTGFIRVITFDARELRPMGQGVFVQVPQQAAPVRAEYVSTTDSLGLYLLNKGRGFFSNVNQRFAFVFEQKNSDGLYGHLTTTWQDLRGIFNSKKQTCHFTLQP